MKTINYDMLPEHMKEGTKFYIEQGFMGGEFMQAVFENNLVNAYDKADSINQEFMYEWAIFLYNEAPRTCWGSPAIIKEWCSHQGLKGIGSA